MIHLSAICQSFCIHHMVNYCLESIEYNCISVFLLRKVTDEMRIVINHNYRALKKGFTILKRPYSSCSAYMKRLFIESRWARGLITKWNDVNYVDMLIRNLLCNTSLWNDIAYYPFSFDKNVWKENIFHSCLLWRLFGRQLEPVASSFLGLEWFSSGWQSIKTQ